MGPTSFHTVADAAVEARRMTSLGHELKEVWRHVLVQLLDDYTSVLRHHDVSAAATMFRHAPPAAGDSRVDAALAALTEHLARRDGWTPPAWTGTDRTTTDSWWFVTDLSGLHPRALVESPLSFRKRGVFITDGALERV